MQPNQETNDKYENDNLQPRNASAALIYTYIFGYNYTSSYHIYMIVQEQHFVIPSQHDCDLLW
jgi:hypothetical protein